MRYKYGFSAILPFFSVFMLKMLNFRHGNFEYYLQLYEFILKIPLNYSTTPLKLGGCIKVGQPVTQLPPYRSRRAELPHRALQNSSLLHPTHNFDS